MLLLRVPLILLLLLLMLVDFIDLLPVIDRRISFSLSALGLVVLALLPAVLDEPTARLPILTPPLSEWLIVPEPPTPPRRWLLRLLIDDDVDDAPDWYWAGTSRTVLFGGALTYVRGISDSCKIKAKKKRS